MMPLAEMQEVGRIPDSILPVDGKKPQESIPTDSDDVYKYCASGKYYLCKNIYLLKVYSASSRRRMSNDMHRVIKHQRNL
ncbi:MAG: hypothetical protein EZS28_019571 [Streblomastix strix]|uniref:Uncharacterized protein n=1 Tax=Streblomastix strix TaxID=222440 RepID=A0A5J4VQK7_9EUKA|nr:MAG: hypothetical protein EZS28_019571 [Streblomastix strix]